MTEPGKRVAGVRRVVVDTNIFWSDLRLNGFVWRRLALLQREGYIDLYLPEVVVREMMRHFGSEHLQNLNKVIEAVASISPLNDALDVLGVHLVETNKKALRKLRNAALAGDAHETELRAKISGVGAKVLPLPVVDTQDMVDAYLAPRKPFKENDKGLADYLIWGSVRELAHSAAAYPVLLLTTNHTDFAKEGELHPDLTATLTPPAEVLVCTNVEAFMAAHQPHFEEIERREEFDYSESSNELALTAAQSYAERRLVGSDISTDAVSHHYGLDIEGIDLPSEIEEPQVGWVEFDRDTVDWQPYEVFNGTTEVGLLECQADLTIRGNVHRSAVFDLEEREDISVGSFDIAEDYYAEVELVRRVAVSLNVQVERNNDAEVVHLERIATA